VDETGERVEREFEIVGLTPWPPLSAKAENVLFQKHWQSCFLERGGIKLAVLSPHPLTPLSAKAENVLFQKHWQSCFLERGGIKVVSPQLAAKSTRS
jgi:hypothetical protein